MFPRGFKTWCERVSLEQRKKLGLRPVDPLDPWSLAENLSVVVWLPEEIPDLDPDVLKTLLRDDPDSWSAVTISVGTKDGVILNSTHSGGRPASDLTHELSHLILGHTPARVDISENGLLILATYNRAQEQEAEWLAGCLLLPRDALLLIRRKKMSNSAACETYGVSLEMLRFRLNVSGVNRQFTQRSSFANKHL